MPGTLAAAANVIHERKTAPIEGALPASAEPPIIPSSEGWGPMVAVFRRRLAASRTTRPTNAEPSGLRRKTGTIAQPIR